MVIKKLMSKIKRKKYVQLISGDHKYCSFVCPVSKIIFDDSKDYKVFHMFQNDEEIKDLEFTLVDYHNHGQLHVYNNDTQINYYILEASQDLETGLYKLYVVESKKIYENYNSAFDNLNFLHEHSAKIFILHAYN